MHIDLSNYIYSLIYITVAKHSMTFGKQTKHATSVNFDRASYCILGNLCADVMQIHEQAQMFRDAPAASLCILEYVYCILADAKTNWHSILQKGMHSSLVSYM